MISEGQDISAPEISNNKLKVIDEKRDRSKSAYVEESKSNKSTPEFWNEVNKGKIHEPTLTQPKEEKKDQKLTMKEIKDMKLDRKSVV